MTPEEIEQAMMGDGLFGQTTPTPPSNTISGVFGKVSGGFGDRVQEASQFLKSMKPENSQAMMVAGLSLLRGDDYGSAGINALNTRQGVIQQRDANELQNRQMKVAERNADSSERQSRAALNNSLKKPEGSSSAFERVVGDLRKNGAISQDQANTLLLEYAKTEATNTSNVKQLSPGSELDLRSLDREYGSAIADVDRMIGAIQEDPTLAGAMLSLRKAGQTGVGMVRDAASLIPEGVKEVLDSFMMSVADALTAGDLSEEDAGQLFNDERVSQARLFENTLAFVIARTRQPTGKLLASNVEAAREDAKLSGMTSGQDVINKLNEVKRILERERLGIRGDLTDLAPARSHNKNEKWVYDGNQFKRTQ
jgi:hypothetical protein